MNDEAFDRELERAIRAEAYRPPMTLDTETLDARLATDDIAPRRSGLRVAFGSVAAAAVVLGAIVVVGELSMRLPKTGQEVAGASNTPGRQGSPTVVSEGDTVVASGNVLLSRDAEDPVLCRLGPVLSKMGASPSCSSVQVAVSRLDPTTLPGWRRQGDVSVSDPVTLTGLWRDGKLEVSNAVSSQAPPYLPDPGVVPCAAPDTGWPGDGDPDAMEAASGRLSAEVDARPELYSGIWGAWIGTARSGPRAVVVGTVGDVAAASATLAGIYPFNLCVIKATYSRSELEALAEQLSGLSQAWQIAVWPPLDKVLVRLVVLDQDTATKLEPYGDKIQLDPLVSPAG